MQLVVGLANPIVPLYAVTFGVSFTLVGFAVGVFGIARVIFEVPGGVFGDKFGRKIIMTIGVLMLTAFGFAASLTTNIVGLSAARFVQGIGTSLYTGPSLAFLGDISSTEKRAKFIATFYAWDFLGTALGPAMGGFLGQYVGFRATFLLVGIISAAALVITQIMMPDIRPDLSQAEPFGLGQLSAAARDSRLLLLASIGTVAFFLASGIRNTAVPLLGQVEGLSVSEIGLLLTIGLLLNAGVNIGGKTVLNRLGYYRLVLISFAFAAIVLVLFPSSHGFFGLALMTSLLTVSVSLIPAIYTSLVIEMAQPDRRGLYFSIFRLFGDGGTLIGPIVVGVLSDLFGLSASFYASAVVCLATFVPAWILMSISRRQVGRA